MEKHNSSNQATLIVKNLPVCIENEKGLLMETVPEATISRNTVGIIELSSKERKRIAELFSKKYRKQIATDSISVDYSRLNTRDIDL